MIWLSRLIVARFSAAGLLLLFATGVAMANSPPGDVSGFIRDPEGQPIRYATVRLWGTRMLGATDSNGHYSVSRVPAGSYTLDASAENFHSLRRDIQIRAGEVLKIDFLLEQTMQYNRSLPHAQGSVDTMIATRGQLFLGGYRLPPPYTLFYFNGALTVNGWQIPRPPEPVVVVPDSIRRQSELIEHMSALERAAYYDGKTNEETVGMMAKGYAASPIVDSVETRLESVVVHFRGGNVFIDRVYRPPAGIPLPDPVKMRRDYLRLLRDDLDDGALVFVVHEGSTMTVPPPWRSEWGPAIEMAKKGLLDSESARLRFGTVLTEQLRTPIKLVKVP